jgi:hypothetical protein
MANADLSAQNSLPVCASIATSTTASDSLITLPGSAHSLDIYLDDSTAGTFGYTSTEQAPLPGQTWVRVWERPRNGPSHTRTVYVAAGAGTPTLHYRVN